MAGATLLHLSGEIDETLDASELVGGVSGEVYFDLDEVRRITSFGVREWMRALRSLDARYIGFVHVRPSLVAQFNMVSDFGAGGEVLTMYLPYVCEWCSEEVETLIDLTKQHAQIRSGEVPKVVCAGCQSDMEFDDLPDSYFAFVANRPAPNPPPSGRRLIGGTDDGPDDKLRVKKEVLGEVTSIEISGRIDKQFRARRIADGLEGIVAVECAGMTSMDDVGRANLLEFLRTPSCRFFLSRLPVALAMALEPLPDGTPKTLRSLDVPIECPSCGARATVECDAEACATFTATKRTIACPRCAKPATATAYEGGIAGLVLRFVDDVPDALKYHLTDHTKVTVHSDKSASQTRPSRTSSSTAETAGTSDTQSGLSTYGIVKKIGQGGMAEVFVAEQRGLRGFQRRVVLKKILPALRAHREFLDMFFQEARVAAQISHQNVVQIFDVGVDADVPFIVMEYVRGWDLRSIENRSRERSISMPIEFACRVVADVAAGLYAAHTATDANGQLLGIVHRDVSPHNVLISSEGAVKITDFGVSKAATNSIETSAGQIKGKLVYMAPEQIDDSLGPVDGRSDVFAAGIILFELLTGQQLFKRDNEFKTMKAVLDAVIPDVRMRRSDVPDAIADVVARALERDLSKRLQSALELQMELEAALATLGRPSTTPHFAAWLRELYMLSPTGDPQTLTPFATTPDASVSLDVDVDVAVEEEPPADDVDHEQADAFESGDDLVQPQSSDNETGATRPLTGLKK